MKQVTKSRHRIRYPILLVFYFVYILNVIFLEMKIKACVLLRIWLFAIPWTVAHQAPLSLGLSWQEYWSGLRFPPPGDLPDPEIEAVSPRLLHWQQVLSHWATWEAPSSLRHNNSNNNNKRLETYKHSFKSKCHYCESFLFYEMEEIMPTFQGCYND